MKTSLLESVFSKAAGLQTCNIIKKRLQHRCFPVNIGKFLRIPISKNIYANDYFCRKTFKNSNPALFEANDTGNK